jgi:hypothetical protein
MKKERILAVIAMAAILIILAAPTAVEAASMESYLGRTDLPKGISQNNPLNLRRTNTEWLGQTKSKKAFAEFTYLVYGTRAGIKNLRSIYNRGNKTVYDIINIWAPASDGNDPKLYAGIVASAMGITPNSYFEFTRDNVQNMVFAMCKVEQGANYITPGTFNAAWLIS